jgi:hypothetical protein
MKKYLKILKISLNFKKNSLISKNIIKFEKSSTFLKNSSSILKKLH